MTRRPLFWAAVALATVLAVVVVVVSLTATFALGGLVLDRFRQHGLADPAPIPTADLSGSGPGSLVSAMTMPGLMRNIGADRLQAARVVYRSSSGEGSPTVVSGSVFEPLGPAPSGGWPVMSFGHGTTGIDEPCAPSMSDSLLGMSDVVAALIKNGYAVAFADYQGLGSAGVHPYTDARTAGRNMIDAVRAMRATFKSVSSRWAAVGESQGGGAAWAADEQARTYAPELELVGAVAVSPAADVTGMVDKAQAGTLTSDQGPAVQLIIESLARLHPDINRDDYRHGAAARYWDVLSACSGPLVHDRDAAAKALNPHDFTPTTPSAADRLRHYLQQWALPQQQLSVPLSVWYGGADTYIDADWTAAAIQRACALGGTVVWKFEKDKSHGEANYADLLRWIADRFAGKPVTNECP
jgi:alpha-beta hydrolase superfamily lysophospholipase